ncbi:MAG: hypothetical protein M3144_12700 [Actinomycetota bacterium]|nr:hypothetical protein [Actinomycetota bacterium]
MAHTPHGSISVRVIGGLLALTVTLAGCARGETISVDGEAVPVSRFTKAVAALCLARQQARTDTAAARRTYFGRADGSIRLALRALGSNRQQAARALADARERVAADFAARPPSAGLFENLGLLVEATRAGLARVAVPTRPCPA